MDPLLLTLEQLVSFLGQLAVQLLVLGAYGLPVILWVVWWLLAVNWEKAWPALSRDGWEIRGDRGQFTEPLVFAAIAE